MKYQNKTKLLAGASVGMLSLSVFGGVSVFGVGSTSGNAKVEMELATSLAMKIASPNDINPDCTPESGVTYGVVNKYASSTGDNSGKVVDTFDGREGEKDEVNTNTSCATLSMSPNTYDSTYSDVTVYTNSGTGYALSVRSADNTSPNLVNTEDSTLTIPAGALTEQDGTGEQAGQKIVPSGQNKWAIKTDTGLIDTWTAVTTEDQTVRAYDQATNNGDTTRVTYGISAGNNPVGKYATTLTYTATMFDGANTEVPTADITGEGGSGTPTGTAISGDAIKGNKLTVPYKATRTLTITPEEGYYLTSFTCPEGFTCTTPATGSPSDPTAASRSAQTVSITNDSIKGTVTDTISVSMSNTYRISFTKSNISSPSASYVDVPYGQSTTVTVTPTSGYYLSGFSGCPSGWTCSGVSTGTSYTGNQTLTLQNNSSVNTGTITLTGTISDPWASCNSATNGQTCYANGVQYIRLADGKIWTASSRGTATWANAASLCPANTHVPSAQEARNLVMAYGGVNFPSYGSPYGTRSGTAGLYNATGWLGIFWSATGNASVTAYAWILGVDSTYSLVEDDEAKTSSYNVVCVH